MRSDLRSVLAAALLVLVGVSAGATPALAAGTGTGDEVRIDGTVTGPDGAPAGDSVVLVGDAAMLSKLSPDELRAFAADDPERLTVVPVGDDGQFETTVPRDRAEAAVAVSDAGISEVVRLGRSDASLSLRLHERRPQTVRASASAVSVDDRRTELSVGLINTGDEDVENLSVTLTSLPDGWTVEDVETDGSYRAADATLTWTAVPAGDQVDATVVLRVPEDAPVGEYTVDLRARSDSHPVAVDPVTVHLRPEETEQPTTRVPAGDGDASTTDRHTATERHTTDPPARESPTVTPVPGFEVAAALAALALSTALLWRRR